MQEYRINVTQIEELQQINDRAALDRIFEKAKSTVIQGGLIILLRKNPDGSSTRFDALDSEEDLSEYRKAVFKYL
jgi:hypothetical protein